MRFSIAAVATALLGSAYAADHIVVVGKGNLTFNPSSVTAAKGDTVTFKFWPKNHSVAQSSFKAPCSPMSGGFWSGFVPTSDTSAASSTSFMYTVENASAPVWFYCTQTSHCENGMVGVINGPSSGNTLEKFMSAAMSTNESSSPVSTAGTGGMIMNGTSMNGTSAASTLSMNNNLAFAGLLGAVTYLVM